MLKVIRQLYGIFEPQERREVKWIFGAVLLMASFDLLGLVSIMPFMTVVADTSIMHRNPNLEWIYNAFNFSSIQWFLFFLGCVSLLLLTIATAVNVGGNWFLIKFTRKCQHTVRKRLMIHYLRQPYTFYLKRNHSDLAENILVEVERLVDGIINPLLNTLARGTIALFVISLLFFLDPTLAFAITLLLVGAYAGIFLSVRKKLERLGEARHEANQMLLKTCSEMFREIKVIKLYGKGETYIQFFSDPSNRMSKCLRIHQLTEVLPRFFLELIGFGGLLLMTLYWVLIASDWGKVLPLIALYAFAGYRLMPSLQHVCGGLINLKFHAPALDTIFRDIKNTQDFAPQYSDEDEIPNSPNLKKQLEIKNLAFSYPEASKPTLRDIDLTISANSLVAFVGATGAGKTTLVDLILGLLKPQQGSIIVDGVPINGDNLSSWQKTLGYVPQDIFLFEGTVAANIAFWVPGENIDIANVIGSAKTAQIHDFIENDLPDGYNTVIGGQGTRLSAGQKQRIGIARALYQKPSFLILDEATNALDGVTEKHFMRAMRNLAQKMTIVCIAHRLSTVKECNAIHMLENETIVGCGTFDELMENCSQFQELGKASHY